MAIGNRVVALAPASARDTGVSTFGTLDKPLLLLGILSVAVVLAAAVGLRYRGNPVSGAALVALFAAVAGLACGADYAVDARDGLLTGLTVFVVGLGSLVLLLGHLRLTGPPPPGPSRRELLLRGGLLGGATLFGGVAARRWLDRSAQVQAARSALALSPAGGPELDLSAAELNIPGLTKVVTPNASFYRIDTALVVPQVDPKDWHLVVDGMVDRPMKLTLDQLLAMPQTEADVTMQCVSNEVGGDLVGSARWQGVLLRDVLTAVGVHPGAGQIVGVSVDGFTAGFPTSYGTDARPAMIALGMNGEILPVERGFPARLIVPGLYGYVSATKWLAAVVLTTWEGFDGFWVPRGWAKQAPIKVASRIDVPAAGASVKACRVLVAGMAWAPGLSRGVDRVEVRVDGGRWSGADLAGELSENTWRQWRWEWDATPGKHVLEVRATDRAGTVQTEAVAPPRPDGATGLHRVPVRVA